MIILALVMSGLSLVLSGIAIVVVLGFLGRIDLTYATKAELRVIDKFVTDMGSNLSKMWRVVEAIDDHTGANSHQVLSNRVPLPDPAPGDR